MSSYQIDEVRELFTSDMNRFLSDLELRAHQLRDDVEAIRAHARSAEEAHGSLAVSFHAIAGTSALLSVASSQQVASHLERVMAGLHDTVHTVLAESDRMDRVRRTCDVAIGALRQIIDAELRGDRALAERRSSEAMARTDDELAGRATTAAPEGSAPSAPSADEADDDAERAELLEVFRDELRTAMRQARAHVDELERGPDREGALSRLGSVLHMMKGSAASVAQDRLAIELRAIYEVVEDYLDRGDVPDAPAARRLRLELAACDPEIPSQVRPAVDAGWDAPAEPAAPAAARASATAEDTGGDAADDAAEARALFAIEARELLARVEAQLGELSRDGGAAREELGRLFHRLKGSALVVGQGELGALAAELEAAARDRAGRAIEPALLARLRKLIGPGGAPAARPAPDRKGRQAVPDLVTGELWDSFVEEAGELIENVERLARALETGAGTQAIDGLLGAIHTLKGAANTVGLSPVGRELHVLETILETLRVAPTAKKRSFVLTRIFDVIERLRRNLRAAPRGEVECAADALEHDLAKLASVDAAGELPSGHSWLSRQDSVWSQPGSGASAEGSSRDHASDAGSDSAGSAGSARAASERRGQERRFIRVAADRLDALMDTVGELIVARSRVLSGLARLGDLQGVQETRRQGLLGIVDAFTEQAEYANLGGVARRSRQPSGAAKGRSAPEFGALEFDVYEEVHVLARRLAEASSDVAETSTSISVGVEHLGETVEELGAIVTSLQSQVNRARMVPLEALFSRLALPARDAAERERKLVDVVFEGAQVVIDKAIADALYAPMLHLVRNAVVHGIESPAARRAKGKPERGTITLQAHQDAGDISISVRDDGAGLDLRALHREGVARGVIGAEVSIDAPEVLELVFSAGLSTASATNDVAGRGVGGDVVRRTVQRLGGAARVSTEEGRGATFALRLPVTLAITRAVIVRDGAQLFAVPLLFVERILRRDEVGEVPGARGARLRFADEILGVFRLGEPSVSNAVVLICSVGGRRLAIEADAVVAQDEVVVKKLGHVLDGHPLFAGAMQRGDGELALVLDMHGVAELHSQTARDPAPRREPAAPRAAGAPAAHPAAAPAAERVAERAAAPDELVVLFVDDSLSVRKVAESALRKLGVKVVTASDGRDALDRLRDQPVSIVFTDLEMPRMHGYELIHEMRYIAAYRDIPIVVVSSRSGDKHVNKALEAGANEYLTKPFSPEMLRGAIERLVPSFGSARAGR